MSSRNSDFIRILESVGPDSKLVAKATARYLASKTEIQRQIYNLITDVIQCGLSDKAYALEGEVVVPDELKSANVPVYLENSPEQEGIIETQGDLAYIPLNILLRSIHYSIFSDDENSDDSISITLPSDWFVIKWDAFISTINSDGDINDYSLVNPFIKKCFEKGALMYDTVDGVSHVLPSIIQDISSITDAVRVWVNEDYIQDKKLNIDLQATLDYYTQVSDDTLTLIAAFECLANGVRSISDFATKIACYTKTAFTDIANRNGDIVNVVETNAYDTDTAVSSLLQMASDTLSNDISSSTVFVEDTTAWSFDNYTGEGGLHALFNGSTWGSSFCGIFGVSVSAVRATVNIVHSTLKIASNFVGKIWTKYAKPFIETQDIQIKSNFDHDYIDLPICTSLVHNNPLYFDRDDLIKYFSDILADEKSVYGPFSNDSNRINSLLEVLNTLSNDENLDIMLNNISPIMVGGISSSVETRGFTANANTATLHRMYDVGSSMVAYDHLNKDITTISDDHIRFRVIDNSNSRCVFDSDPDLKGSSVNSSGLSTRVFMTHPLYEGESKCYLDDEVVHSDRSLIIPTPDLFYSYKSNVLDFYKLSPSSYDLKFCVAWGYSRFASLLKYQTDHGQQVKSGSISLRSVIRCDFETEGFMELQPGYYGPFSPDHHDCIKISLQPRSFVDYDGVSRPAPDNLEARSLNCYQTFDSHLQPYLGNQDPAYAKPFARIRFKYMTGVGDGENFKTTRCVNLSTNESMIDQWLTYDDFIDSNIGFRCYSSYVNTAYMINIEFDDGTIVLYYLRFLSAEKPSSNDYFNPSRIQLQYVKTTHINKYVLRGYGFEQSYYYEGAVKAVPVLEIRCPSLIPVSLSGDLLNIGVDQFHVEQLKSPFGIKIGDLTIQWTQYDSAGSLTYMTYSGLLHSVSIIDKPYVGVPDCNKTHMFSIYCDYDGNVKSVLYDRSVTNTCHQTLDDVTRYYNYDDNLGRFYISSRGKSQLTDKQIEALDLVDSYNIIDTHSVAIFDYGTMKIEFFQSAQNRCDYVMYMTPIDYVKLMPNLREGDSSLSERFLLDCDDESKLKSFIQNLLTPCSISDGGNDTDKIMLLNVYATNVWNEITLQCLHNPDGYLRDTINNVKYGNYQFISIPHSSEVIDWCNDNVNNAHFFQTIVSNGKHSNSCYRLLSDKCLYDMYIRILSNRTSFMKVYYSIFQTYPDMIPYVEGERFGDPRFHIMTDDENNKAIEILVNAIAIAIVMISAAVVVKTIKKMYKKKISKLKSSRKVKQKRAASDYEAVEIERSKCVDEINSVKKDLKSKDLSEDKREQLKDTLSTLSDKHAKLSSDADEKFNKCFKLMKKESLLAKLIPGYANAAVISAASITAVSSVAGAVTSNGLKIGAMLKASDNEAVNDDTSSNEGIDATDLTMQTQEILSAIDAETKTLSSKIESNSGQVNDVISEIDSMLVQQTLTEKSFTEEQNAVLMAALMTIKDVINQNASSNKPPQNYNPIL